MWKLVTGKGGQNCPWTYLWIQSWQAFQAYQGIFGNEFLYCKWDKLFHYQF